MKKKEKQPFQSEALSLPRSTVNPEKAVCTNTHTPRNLPPSSFLPPGGFSEFEWDFLSVNLIKGSPASLGEGKEAH